MTILTNSDREKVAYKFNKNEDDKINAAIFRKQILKKGVFAHPNNPKKQVTFNENIFAKIIESFEDKVISNVPVILDSHKESYNNTTGRVLGLEQNEKGLYATIEIVDEAVINKIESKLSDGKGVIDEVSVSLGPVISDTGKKYDIALWHLAIVPHGYFANMDGFEKLIASISNEEQEEQNIIILQGDNKMEVKEILEYLNNNGIKVESLEDIKSALNANDKNDDTISKISAMLNVDKSNGNDDIVSVVNTLQASIQAKDDKIDSLLAAYHNKEAETAVGELVTAGKVVPANREDYISLYKTDEKLFASITANLPVVVDTEVKGSNTAEKDINANSKDDIDVNSELERYKNKINAMKKDS